ncbi:hypothetical protein HAALTHF_46390n [Vreelandella aquamarina]|nr:hypothetical protein HAALTHF_46390n [Halomonas axialensis]
MAEWRNDCEATVKNATRVSRKHLTGSRSTAPSRLTGTGACLFAAFESQEAAQTVAELANQRWQAWVARGLNTSPLQDALGC